MPAALLTLLAFAACILGLAWLALTMDAHWRQVRGAAAAVRSGAARGAADAGDAYPALHGRCDRRDRAVLRVLGIAALGLALMACLRANHASIAALVWIMSVAVASLVVALLLAWRPRWLAWTVAWLR